MSRKWGRLGGILAVIACVAVPAVAIGSGPAAKGRMTGGGKVVGKAYKNGKGTKVYVTHGFTLGCDIPDRPQRLQVNWSGGNHFHLESLEMTECHDSFRDEGNPVAGFDLYKGWGTGRLNGKSGAKIEFKFTDNGEPGVNDEIKMKIITADGVVMQILDGTLELGGNHQAHRETGNDLDT